MSDLWTNPPPKPTPVVEVPLRPAEMLARYRMDRSHTCGTCAHYFLSVRRSPRCRLSLNGNPEHKGWLWQPAWKACGRWQARPDDPAAAPPAHTQPTLL